MNNRYNIIFQFLIILMSPIFLFALDRDLTGVIVQDHSQVMLRTSIPKFINPELINVLKAGVTISVVYEVKISKKTFLPNFVVDKKLTYKKSLAYNIQDNIYVLQAPNQSYKKSDLKKILDDFYSEDIIVLGKRDEFLLDQVSYNVRYRLTTETIKLYPPLSIIFGFIEIYNFTTAWKTLELDKKK